MNTEPFERVLLATQGTKFDAAAEDVALALASRPGIRLAVVYPEVSNPEYVSVAPELAARAEIAASRVLDGLRARAAQQGVQVEGRVRLGEEPFFEIVEEARARAADLIVIRNRGKRGALLRLLVGDIAARVIGQAPCHVLSVPQAARMWGKRLLLATDGSPHSAAAATLAAKVARSYGLVVLVVSAVEEGHSAEWRAQAGQLVADTAGELARAGLAAEGRVVEGRPHEAVIRQAREWGSDLIVLGSHGRTGLTKLQMGSTTERVVGLATCPILIAKLQ